MDSVSQKRNAIIGFIGGIGAITLGVIWKIIFKDMLIGNAWGACESLGEGLMYLTAYFYWKKNHR